MHPQNERVPESNSHDKAFRRQALIYGLLCAPLGIAIGLFVSIDSGDSSFRFFPLHAGLAAFLMPAFLWWVLVQRRNRPTWNRALVVGILSGLLSHWLCWYLMLLWANFDYWVLAGPGSSLGEAPVGPLYGLVGTLVYCMWSWLLFGWLTVAAAVALALLRVRIMNRGRELPAE